jgi:hypothetical protein
MHFSKHLHRGRARDAVGIAVVGSVLLCLAPAGPALAGTSHSGSHAPAKPKPARHAPAKPKPARHAPAKPKPARHAPAKPPASSATPSSWADYYVVGIDASAHRQVIYELTVKWLDAQDFGLDVFQLGQHGVVPPGASVVQPGWIVALPASASSPAASSPANPAASSPANPPAAPAPGGWASHYTIKTAGDGSNAVQYELMVQAQDGGGLSLDLLQLAGGGSAQVPAGVIRPSWVLVLPANAAAPMAPAGPLASATQTSGVILQSSGERPRPVVASKARTNSAGWAWAAVGAGLAAIIALLLALCLLYRRSGGSSARRAGVPKPPASASNPAGGPGGTIPLPTLPARALPVSRLDDVSLPDELVPAQPQLVTAAGSGAGELAAAGGLAGREAPAEVAAGLSPVALRMLTARRRDGTWDETASVPVQRLQVFSGDDQIDIALAEVPAAGHDDEPDAGLAGPPPYLAWTLLPYDIPGNGVAFACLGAGDEGCLFLDLGAAPGVIALGGDRAAAARLAESLAHQLSMPGDAGHRLDVIVVGDAVPEPLPAGVRRVASLFDLRPAGSGDATRVIFCQPRSNEEAFALARHIVIAQHDAIPVVVGDLPGAPWSFAAQPALLPDRLLAR